MDPMKSPKIFLLVLFISAFYHVSLAQSPVDDPDPHRFQQEIDTFLQWDAKNSFPDHAILFVGSSSIRFWKSHQGFPQYPVINRGFGGAHISDIQFYYDQVIGKYHPSMIVFYCGDNDIAADKPVSQVMQDYKQLTDHILKDFPDIKFVYVPIKPSSSRWSYWPKMKRANQQIKTYNQQNGPLFYVDLATPLLGSDGKPDDSLFRDDVLHLNDKGYAIWNEHLAPVLQRLYQSRN